LRRLCTTGFSEEELQRQVKPLVAKRLDQILKHPEALQDKSAEEIQ